MAGKQDLAGKVVLVTGASRGIGYAAAIEAAKRGHSAEWIAQTEARTGGKVNIAYFDLFMLLDNQAGTVTHFPE